MKPIFVKPKKLVREYTNGDRYLEGGIFGLKPHGVKPVAVYDISDFSDEEYRKLMRNPNDKQLMKKAKKMTEKEAEKWAFNTPPKE